MKITITIAIIFNIYGVLSFTHESNEYQNHPHRHRHSNHVSGITADELVDVLLSLPESKGRQAYRSFLSLGEFLPVETKAHKFFNSVAEAIRRKSEEEISELRRIKSPQPLALSSNPIFMVQPAGYHMAPLPLHPMFSSSPLDFITRVPCTHTKMIAVPMHTFDMSISSITRQFEPAQNSFDGLLGSDDDDEDDKSYFNEEDDDEDELNKLFDLIGFPNSKGEDKKVAQSPKPEENEAEQSPNEGNEKTESPKPEGDEITESPKPEGDEITESPKPEEGDVIESPISEGDEITESPKAKEEVIESPKQEDDKAVQLPKQEESEVTEPPNQEGVTQSSTPEDEIRKSPKPEEDEVIESSKPEGNEAVQSPKQEDEVNQVDKVEQPSTPDHGVTESLKPEEVIEPSKQGGEEEQLPKQVEDEVKESSKQEDETTQLLKQGEVEAAQSPIQEAEMQSPEQEETTEPKKESVEEQEIQEPELAEVPSAKTSPVKRKRGPPKVRKTPGLDSTTEDVIKPVPGRKPRKKKVETQPQQQ